MSNKKEPMQEKSEKEITTEDNKKPIVNVDWSPPTWTDQFMKFIADLSGNTNNDKKNN